MNTREKIDAVIAHVATISPDDLPPDLHDLVVNFQAAKGLLPLVGVKLPSNLVGLILPDDPTEAAILLDRVISMLLMLRDDDAPPFDADRYGEDIVNEILGAA